MFSPEILSLNAFVVLDLARMYQDLLQMRGPWNVMQCNLTHDIFSRDFEFERICCIGFGMNAPRHITGEGNLEYDAV